MPRPLFFVLVFFLAFMACEKNDECPLDEPVDGEWTSILLGDLVANEEGVELKWTVSHDSIVSFDVYRQIGVFDPYENSPNLRTQLIASSLNKETLSFVDKNVPYSPLISYLVAGNMGQSDNPYYPGRSVISNAVEYVRNITLLSFRADDVVYYQKKDILFLVNRTDGVIKAYNYKTKVETELDCRSRIGFCILNTNNQTEELFVPREDGWLFIYNANNFELIEQIKISASGLFSSVIKNNLIFTSTDSYNNALIVTNRTTGENVFSNNSWYRDQNRRLEIVPGTNTEIFGSNSNEITYYRYDSNGQLLSRNNFDPWDNEYSMSARYEIIPKSKKIISAPMGNIYDHSIKYVNGLPRGSLSFTDFVLSSDGAKVLAASKNSKTIEVYSLSDFTHIETIKTKGYPERLFYDNGTLISVSKSFNADFYYTTLNEFFIEEIAYALE